MSSSPRFVLPHLRARFVILSLGFIALLSFFAFAAQAQKLSLPGLRSPEKNTSAKKELSVKERAARGQAPFNRLYEHVKVSPSKFRRLAALSPREAQDTGMEKRLRIGEVRVFPRPVKVSTDSTFYSVAEGDVRVMGVISEGALYTRVHFTGMSLPAGARVFVYSLQNPDEFYGPYEGKGPSDDGTFWTPPMEGEGVAIEYFTPHGEGDAATAPFQVSEVSHIFGDPSTKAGIEKAAGSCNLEVAAEWAEVAKSVGELQFTSGGGEYLCTGTLLNNQANDFTPYLLTANHCFNTQVEAQTLRVYWNYNTGNIPPSGTPFTDGATLLATGTGSDFTFVVLTGSLPGGLFFSGWDASPTSQGTPVTGIHHPQGSHKRISFGATNANCANGLPGPCSNFTGVTWSSGTTEPGSSGSGIWKGTAANPQLVGTLTGGGASCSTPTLSDYYGRFSNTYPSIAPFLTTATGTSCVSALNPTSQYVHGSSGGTGSISVTAPGGCNWTAARSHSFVTITSGASGSGNGTLNFSVAPNAGAYRAAVIVVGARVFTVTQAGVNDNLPAVSISDVSVEEGDFLPVTVANVTVSLSAPSSQTVSVRLRSSDNTATGGTDYYSLFSESVIFSPGETTKTVAVSIIGDTKVEPDETFFIDLVSPFNAILSKSRATVTILNDDVVPTVSLSINDVTITEGGNVGSTPATFTVTLSAPTAKTVKVNFIALSGTAGVGTEFPHTMGTLTFSPGQTTQTITVFVFGDTIFEGNESFIIELRDPANALLADAQGTCTIIDDESAPVLSIDDITIVEGNSGQKTAIFKVSLSTQTTQQVSVSYTTSAGTATENQDYMKSWGSTIVGSAGTTLFVNINGDTVYEGDETFFMTLSNPSGAVLGKSQATCTIINDDVPQAPIQLILEESAPVPNLALAVDATLLLRDPFPVVNAANLLYKGTDKNTKVIVFVTNLQLAQGEAASAVIVNLVDGNNQTHEVAAQEVRLVPGLSFTQVVFRLPDTLAPGTCAIKVKAHGQETNSGTMRIGN